jgi:hypothetical protein
MKVKYAREQLEVEHLHVFHLLGESKIAFFARMQVELKTRTNSLVSFQSSPDQPAFRLSCFFVRPSTQFHVPYVVPTLSDSARSLRLDIHRIVD